MRLAIVVPRYGTEIGGGAETQARGFAEEASRRGWQVAVLTTCARSHYTWKNELAEGESLLNGVRIRRFPVSDWQSATQAILENQLASNRSLSRAAHYQWLACGPHSEPLYRYLATNASHFDVLVMLPYTVPLIHYAAQIAPARTVIWPCLHDENYAFLEPVRLLLESTCGVMFNTPEERLLALQKVKIKPQREAVLGEGVMSATSFMQDTHPNRHLSPDLLYVGRLEGGKNIEQLYRYVKRFYAEGSNMRLTVVGSGPLTPPKEPAFDFRGFVDETEKRALLSSALALCQPSLNESFSLVMMESWLCARPALVHSHCAVTLGHTLRSKGGLAYGNYDEFAEAVTWLKENPVQGQRMGANGRQYVLSNYTWPAVATRFEKLCKEWAMVNS